MFSLIQHLHLTVNVSDAAVQSLVNAIHSAKETIMANQSQLAVQLTALGVQADKSKAEILAKLAELQAALDAAGDTTPEVDFAMEALTAKLQGVDDIVPDPQP